MPLSPKLEAKLSKKLEPDTKIEDTFAGNDLTIITDKEGNAVTLFIGKRRPDGAISGERYVKRFKFGPDGQTILASHWESKGKVSRS